MVRSVPAESSERVTIHLQSISRPHLFGAWDFDPNGRANVYQVTMLGAITLVIIGIASINFLNLAIARIVARTDEVTTRVALGASRGDVFAQFVTEAMVVAALALLLGFGLAFVAPVQDVFGQFRPELLQDWRAIAGLGVATGFVGLLAGVYPAFAASRVSPVASGGGSLFTHGKQVRLRNVLIVAQLACSAFFIVCAETVRNQTQMMETADVGFDQDQVVTTRFAFTGRDADQRDVVLDAFRRVPGVVAVTSLWPGPGAGERRAERVRHADADPLNSMDMRILGVDPGFLKTYGVELLAGRNIGPDFARETEAEFLLNETAIGRLGWSSPQDTVGQPLQVGDRAASVVGVVHDFEYRSVHQPTMPMVLLNWARYTIAIRVSLDDVSGTMDRLNATWERFYDKPPELRFVSEWMNHWYWQQRRQSRQYFLLAWSASLLASLGVFGLAAYEAEQRRREVGIRKVLGASVVSILTLFWKNNIKLIAIANGLAWSIGYWMMDQWLSEFALRIDLTLVPFVLAGFTTTLLFLSVIGSQAVRIGRVDPAETLRSE